jgi:hypothetical protein
MISIVLLASLMAGANETSVKSQLAPDTQLAKGLVSAAECTPNLPAAIVSRPPMDAVLEVMKKYQPQDHYFSGVRASASQYRTYAGVIVAIGGDGVPVSATFNTSTGNRDVDIALRKLALDMRFSPDPCAASKVRTVVIPFDLR